MPEVVLKERLPNLSEEEKAVLAQMLHEVYVAGSHAKILVKGTTQIYCPFCHSPLVDHDCCPDVSETPYFRYEWYGVRCTQGGAKGRLEERWDKEVNHEI